MRHLLLIAIVLFTGSLFGQGNSQCSGAASFCSGSPSQYPAGTGSGQAQGGINYSCLGSQPNPAWFTIPVSQSGPLSILISAARDVDFIAWGPFPGNSTGNCTNLNAASQVPNTGGNNGCSYSGSPTETLNIANATAGDVYILLVTNFSNQSQPINISQLGGSGAYGNYSIVGTNSVCSGGTATLEVVPDANIQGVQWWGPNGLVGANFNQTFPNLTATTVYTVIGFAAASQTCASYKTIVVVPTPTPVLSNNGPLCETRTASFTATGASTYTWTGPANYYGLNANPIRPGAQLAHTGIYTVVGTSTAGCTGTTTTFLQVKPNPTVTIGSSGNYCYGKSFSLLSGGATTYTWAGPNSFNYQGQNPIFFNNTLSMTGNYMVTGEVNGCTSTAGTLITINPLPNVIASSSGSVCQNSGLTLSASGASIYTWTGPSGFTSHQSTITVNSGQPYMAGIYQLTGTDGNGCVNTSTVYQAVHAAPFINIYSSNACLNKNINLNADGGAVYRWTGPNNYASNIQSPIITNASPLNTGVYNVTVTSLYGCSNTASVESTVYMNPNINYTGETEICKGKVFSFSAKGGINYKWLNSTGIVTELPTFTISSVSPDLQATYTLVGTDGNFCSSSVMFYPIVNALPAARIIPDKDVSCAPFCSAISLDLLSSNITNQKWYVSDGDKNATGASTLLTKCFSTAGIYTVNVNLTDANGCTDVMTKTIQALPTPKADFITSPEKPTENDNVVTFIDASKNASTSSWTWNFYHDTKGSRDTSYLESPSHTYTSTGNYMVYMKVVGTNGCADSVAKVVVVYDDPTFFIPNTFTPNGDNLNDVFMPKAVGLKNYEMQIFSRWGKLLFSTTDPTMGWNGKTGNGEVAPTDSYIYKFTLSGMGGEPKVYTGHFSLIK